MHIFRLSLFSVFCVSWIFISANAVEEVRYSSRVDDTLSKVSDRLDGFVFLKRDYSYGSSNFESNSLLIYWGEEELAENELHQELFCGDQRYYLHLLKVDVWSLSWVRLLTEDLREVSREESAPYKVLASEVTEDTLISFDQRHGEALTFVRGQNIFIHPAYRKVGSNEEGVRELIEANGYRKSEVLAHLGLRLQALVREAGIEEDKILFLFEE